MCLCKIRDVEVSTADLTQNDLVGRVVRIRQDTRPPKGTSERLDSNDREQDDCKDDVKSDRNEHRTGNFERMQDGTRPARDDQ